MKASIFEDLFPSKSERIKSLLFFSFTQLLIDRKKHDFRKIEEEIELEIEKQEAKEKMIARQEEEEDDDDVEDDNDEDAANNTRPSNQLPEVRK